MVGVIAASLHPDDVLEGAVAWMRQPGLPDMSLPRRKRANQRADRRSGTLAQAVEIGAMSRPPSSAFVLIVVRAGEL